METKDVVYRYTYNTITGEVDIVSSDNDKSIMNHMETSLGDLSFDTVAVNDNATMSIYSKKLTKNTEKMKLFFRQLDEVINTCWGQTSQDIKPISFNLDYSGNAVGIPTFNSLLAYEDFLLMKFTYDSHIIFYGNNFDIDNSSVAIASELNESIIKHFDNKFLKDLVSKYMAAINSLSEGNDMISCVEYSYFHDDFFQSTSSEMNINKNIQVRNITMPVNSVYERRGIIEVNIDPLERIRFSFVLKNDLSVCYGSKVNEIAGDYIKQTIRRQITFSEMSKKYHKAMYGNIYKNGNSILKDIMNGAINGFDDLMWYKYYITDADLQNTVGMINRSDIKTTEEIVPPKYLNTVGSVGKDQDRNSYVFIPKEYAEADKDGAFDKAFVSLSLYKYILKMDDVCERR